MKQTKYKKVMDEIHCPPELIQKLQQQSKQGDQSRHTEEYYIDIHKKKPLISYLSKAAVFFLVCVTSVYIVHNVWNQTKHSSPMTGVQSSEDKASSGNEENSDIGNKEDTVAAKAEEPSAENEEGMKIVTEDASDSESVNLAEPVDENVVSFFQRDYAEFQWNMKKTGDRTSYELWNEENQVKLTYQTDDADILLIHNGSTLSIPLPYGFIPINGDRGETKMYFHDVLGNGSDQLIVNSSCTGTMGTSYDFDVYDLEAMKKITINEDISFLESQLSFEVLSYYDQTLTYLLTISGKDTYLMSENLGLDLQTVEELLLADTFYAESWETENQSLANDSISFSNYEVRDGESGFTVTYDIIPYVSYLPFYCGALVADYKYNGTEFVLDENSIHLDVSNESSAAISVDADGYQWSREEGENGKYTTWYLSKRHSESDYLLIQLSKEGQNRPKATSAYLISDGAYVPVNEIVNKEEIQVIWASDESKGMVISYYQEPLDTAYDDRTFFVYDRKERKVVYENALTFNELSKACKMQGNYLIAHPDDNGQESFNVICITEDTLVVEYSFKDQEDFIRKGSFIYQYNTGDYSDLKKDYQELSDQFVKWDHEQIGKEFKTLIMNELSEKLRGMSTIDKEFLSDLSLYIQVTEYEDFSVITYTENPEVYGNSGHGNWMILWTPGNARVFVSDETLSFEKAVKLSEQEYLMIVSNYQISQSHGKELILVTDSEEQAELLVSKVMLENAAEDGFDVIDQVTLYAKENARVDDTVTDDAIVFHSGNSEYKVYFKDIRQ